MAENRVKSAKTTMAMVRQLQSMGGATLTELAREIDMPTSTVHNYLKTLEEEEYVVEEDSTYHVGLQFLEHGAHARDQQKLYRTAKPEIDKLADETGELGNLLVEEHGRGVYLHRVRGDDAVRVQATVGTRVFLHSTGLGKVILAHMSEERKDTVLDRHGLPERTPQTITDRAELEERLEQIRERGYAIDDEERIKGLRCVAVPILDNDGGIVGAASVAGPTNRLCGDRLEETLPEKLLEVGNVIELNYTHS